MDLDAVGGDLLRRRRERVVLHVGGDDVQPGGREPFRERQPDAAPGARDDRDLTPLKFHVGILTSGACSA